MAQCKICGKKGLFLKVDSVGRCKDCANAELERFYEEFDTYYNEILSLWKKIKEGINTGCDPIKALDFIPSFEKKISDCDVLISQIKNPSYVNSLTDRIKNNMVYKDDFDKRFGRGYITDWDINFYHNNDLSSDKIISELENSINIYRRRWTGTINSIKKSAEFQRLIDNIPTFSVEPTDTKHNKLIVSGLDELIKYTNITAKTSYDRIGNFVVIDTETTGLSCIKENMVEVAAVRFEDWTPVEKFHTMINPGKPIPQDAIDVHGITDDMVADAPTFKQVIDSLDSFVGKSNLVGHNLPFDLKFLYRHGYDFTTTKRKYYDTLEIAKKTLKKPKMKWDKEYEEYVINDDYNYDVEDYKLTTLCDYYNIRDNRYAHRSLSDALATGLLFQKLAMDKIKN